MFIYLVISAFSPIKSVMFCSFSSPSQNKREYNNHCDVTCATTCQKIQQQKTGAGCPALDSQCVPKNKWFSCTWIRWFFFYFNRSDNHNDRKALRFLIFIKNAYLALCWGPLAKNLDFTVLLNAKQTRMLWAKGGSKVQGMVCTWRHCSLLKKGA